jgi:hypothetical protein
VAIGNGQPGGLIFFINGKIRGGSFATANGEAGLNRKNQELLIQTTQKHGGSFTVCRIPLSKLNATGGSQISYARPSPKTLAMVEELLAVFEETLSSEKKMKANFSKLLKKKFVENAEKYAFLDPFAGELEYAERQLQFTGNATDRELIDGITESLQQLIQELGLGPQFTKNTAEWSQKYSKQLADFNIKLT